MPEAPHHYKTQDLSKTRILIHVVFVTKNRYQTIPLLKRERLYSYIKGIISNHSCNTLAINGMSDHIHILLNLHPNQSLAEEVQQIKGSSSKWMKEEQDFIKFGGWGKGYFAASVSPTSAEACIKYIENQENHHGGKGLMEEINYLLANAGLSWYEDDWN